MLEAIEPVIPQFFFYFSLITKGSTNLDQFLIYLYSTSRKIFALDK